MQAMTVAIGVSVGTAQLSAPSDGDEGVANSSGDPAAYIPQLAIALCEAVLFAANVAPTEENVIIGAESSPTQLLGLVATSLAVCALMFHFADFRGADFIRRFDRLGRRLIECCYLSAPKKVAHLDLLDERLKRLDLIGS